MGSARGFVSLLGLACSLTLPASGLAAEPRAVLEQAAQREILRLPEADRPSLTSGDAGPQLRLPSDGAALEFAHSVFRDLSNAAESGDVEAQLHLRDDRGMERGVLTRWVWGAKGSAPLDVVDQRAGILLVAIAGQGVDGAYGSKGGRGGDLTATVTGSGSAAILIAGRGGDGGPGGGEGGDGGSVTKLQFAGGALDLVGVGGEGGAGGRGGDGGEQPGQPGQPGQDPGGQPGQQGQPGGVRDGGRGGNGGNGGHWTPDTQPCEGQRLTGTGGRGGDGGRGGNGIVAGGAAGSGGPGGTGGIGGTAVVRCAGSEEACGALAVGGEGGEGGLGGTGAGPAAPQGAGGNGGVGGRGGDAFAQACCDESGTAYGGTGGVGGKGGRGCPGGDGGRGGFGAPGGAQVSPGTTDGLAHAEGGNGGQGGPGGPNFAGCAAVVAGFGGAGGVFGVGSAVNECPRGRIFEKNGRRGRWGQDAPQPKRAGDMGLQLPQVALRISPPVPAPAPWRLEYSIPSEGDASLMVYNAAGEAVRLLATGRHAAGQYSARWDGRNDAGHEVAAGTYFVRLQCGGTSVSEKLIVTR